MHHLITQYPLAQGALEIEYIEEFFHDFPRRKTAAQVTARLGGRDHLILMAEAPLPDDPSTVVPVAYKVAHELREHETDPALADLVRRLRGCVSFDGRKVLYQWIGGTRRDWRGQGHFRALTEEQEAWAIHQGFQETIAKTKNRFYNMRATLDRLRFHVVRFEANLADNRESKIYLSKHLTRELLEQHASVRAVTHVGDQR